MNFFGGVILTGKNTHVVDNMQMSYDPLFMPFKDKPSTNPRYEALYNVLGRVNDKLQTNDDCESGKQGLERAESSDEESSNADSSLVPNIGQEDVVVDAADDDSSDDDIVDETVKEMHEILVKVSPFNPLCVDKSVKKRSLRTVPSIVWRVNSKDANADEQLLNELRKGNGGDKQGMDASDLEASSSSETLTQTGHHTRSKSKGRGKVRQTLSLGKRVVGSRISGAGLVVKKRQVLGTKKASLTRNFKVSKNALLVNKNLLKGQKLLRHFPGFGNYFGTVKRFSLEWSCYGRMSLHVGGIGNGMRSVNCGGYDLLPFKSFLWSKLLGYTA